MDTKYIYFLESASELFPHVSAFIEENCMMTSWQHELLKRESLEGAGCTDAGLPDIIKRQYSRFLLMSLPIKPSIEFDNEYVTFLTMEKINKEE